MEKSNITIHLNFDLDHVKCKSDHSLIEMMIRILEYIMQQPIDLLRFEATPLINRKEHDKSNSYQCILVLNKSEYNFQKMREYLQNLNTFISVDIVDEAREEDIFVPKHISDLDKCRNVLVKFNPELHSGHPGYYDQEYRERRIAISNLTFDYQHGDVYPTVAYNDSEVATWRAVYRKMGQYHSKYACKEYIEGLKLLELHCGYSEEAIPQMKTVSEFLHRTTGMRLRPVSGLLSPRDFLASLAFRVFQCSQYVRHSTSPFHTPEPDVIHELLGHVPMFTSRSFTDFSQIIGLASLGATEDEITKLSTLYWFTIEFGLCKQNGELRAVGAGLLSSYGELENAFSDKSQKLPLDSKVTPNQQYDDYTYQPIYFVADSFEQMKQCIRKYVRTMNSSNIAVYDAITETVQNESKNNYKEMCFTQVEEQINQLKNLM